MTPIKGRKENVCQRLDKNKNVKKKKKFSPSAKLENLNQFEKSKSLNNVSRKSSITTSTAPSKALSENAEKYINKNVRKIKIISSSAKLENLNRFDKSESLNNVRRKSSITTSTAPSKALSENEEKYINKNVRKRKIISLSAKLENLNRFDKSESLNNVRGKLSISTSTATPIKDQKLKLQESIKAGTSVSSARINRRRSRTMDKVERLLSLWISDKNKNIDLPLCSSLIRQKALGIYKSVIEQEGEHGEKKVFTASKGWFFKFCRRHNMHMKAAEKNLLIKGHEKVVCVGSNVETALDLSKQLKRIIKEEGYSPQQVFNVATAGLFWKNFNEVDIMDRDERSGKLSILLGGNAAGDMKLKPLIVHRPAALDPRVLQTMDQDNLPVMWRKSNSSLLNSTIFTDWFYNYFCPAVKRYCSCSSISCKILLLLNNSPCYPPNLISLSPYVKVIFLPKNIVQPMNEGIMAALKADYLRRTFRQLLYDTDGAEKSTVKEWWSNYDIYDAGVGIGKSWEEIKKSTMNGVWKNIWPECVNNIEDVVDVSSIEGLSEIQPNSLNVADEVGLKEIKNSDSQDILNARSEFVINNEELLSLDNGCKPDSDNRKENVALPLSSKQLTLKCLAEAMSHFSAALNILIENDPNVERSYKVSRGVYRQIDYYVGLYDFKKTMKQLSNLESEDTSHSYPVNNAELAINAASPPHVTLDPLPSQCMSHVTLNASTSQITIGSQVTEKTDKDMLKNADTSNGNVMTPKLEDLNFDIFALPDIKIEEEELIFKGTNEIDANELNFNREENFLEEKVNSQGSEEVTIPSLAANESNKCESLVRDSDLPASVDDGTIASHVQCKIVENATTRGGSRLIDSNGYSYTKGKICTNGAYWRCCTRNKNVCCVASVKRISENDFCKVLQKHCHPPPLLAWESAIIKSTVKAKAVQNPFVSAFKIAQAELKKYCGTNPAATNIINPVNLASNANYLRKQKSRRKKK